MVNKPLTEKIVREIVKEELIPIESRLNALEKRFDAFEEKIVSLFEKFRSDIYTMIDPLVRMAETKEEEQIIHRNQHDELRDDVESLKKIHPKFLHATV